jgi:protein involved in sex pheromone biosynthesis
MKQTLIELLTKYCFIISGDASENAFENDRSFDNKSEHNKDMVFIVTCNNISVISWRSVLLMEQTGGPGENHRPVASHCQTLWHTVV